MWDICICVNTTRLVFLFSSCVVEAHHHNQIWKPLVRNFLRGSVAVLPMFGGAGHVQVYIRHRRYLLKAKYNRLSMGTQLGISIPA